MAEACPSCNQRGGIALATQKTGLGRPQATELVEKQNCARVAPRTSHTSLSGTGLYPKDDQA